MTVYNPGDVVQVSGVCSGRLSLAIDTKAPLGSEMMCIFATETFVAVRVLTIVGVMLGVMMSVEGGGSGVEVGEARVAVLVGVMAMVSGVGVGAGTAVVHPTNNNTTINPIILFISPPLFASNPCSGQLYFPQNSDWDYSLLPQSWLKQRHIFV